MEETKISLTLPNGDVLNIKPAELELSVEDGKYTLLVRGTPLLNFNLSSPTEPATETVN